METENSLRERLVDVGVELVTTEGTAALGLREIARRAGVSHGAPRRHFPTHQALLSAIAHRGYADLRERFAAADSSAGSAAGPRERLAALAMAYARFAVENRAMFELMFRHDLLNSEEQGVDGPRLRDTTLPLFREMVALVAEHREQRTADAQRAADSAGGAANRSGKVADSAGPVDDPATATAALWGNVHGIAQLWAWRSLPLMLGTDPSNTDRLAGLVGAALDAHLGPDR
ncbi:TetR/AcrR family transcriptional regulator [Streptomyces spirodelae]|uniref:TetR/AcrR family transcriptional regulator n=1 Tax=Streptomyces spirodelae TaxID=2812904 RepID=A0ABS3WM75_9ACTN|nr:TetR/AcrR family transcriptional regulator [Streptomyces spirodelae]MBO8184119.1 TetR/AcrR family transcriptional regulator [Streptomyces spirodelae]